MSATGVGDGEAEAAEVFNRDKAETVRLIQRSGKSTGRRMALELGIGETALRRWVDQAEVEAGRGPGDSLQRSEREELVEVRRENQRLRMEREILKKATAFSPRRASEIRFYRSGEGQLSGDNAVPVLQVSQAGFYAWQKQPPAARTLKDQKLTLEVAAIFAHNRGRYGSPWIHIEFYERGERTARTRVARLMRVASLRARGVRRVHLTTDSNRALAISGNLLARRFAVAAPTAAGSPISPICGRMKAEVGQEPSQLSGDTQGVQRQFAFQPLSQRQVGAGLLHHSERGSQYASDEYRQLLAQHAIKGSMSR